MSLLSVSFLAIGITLCIAFDPELYRWIDNNHGDDLKPHIYESGSARGELVIGFPVKSKESKDRFFWRTISLKERTIGSSEKKYAVKISLDGKETPLVSAVSGLPKKELDILNKDIEAAYEAGKPIEVKVPSKPSGISLKKVGWTTYKMLPMKKYEAMLAVRHKSLYEGKSGAHVAYDEINMWMNEDEEIFEDALDLLAQYKKRNAAQEAFNYRTMAKLREEKEENALLREELRLQQDRMQINY